MTAQVEVRCACGAALSVDVDMLGKQGTCPSCGARFLLWSDQVARTATDRHWYAQLEGRARGPVTFLELRRLVSEGRVDRDTRVRQGRTGEWLPASEVHGDIQVGIPLDPRPREPSPGTRRAQAAYAPRATSPLTRLWGASLLLVGALLVAFLLVTSGDEEPVEQRHLTTTEIVRRTLPSVAIVRGRRSSGSGFIVAPGVLLTNYHVIEHELLRNVVVDFPSARKGGQGYTPRLHFADRTADLAFLTLDSEVEPLRIASKHAFVPGEEILVIGSPGIGGGRMVLQNAVARGLLSTSVQLDGLIHYQLDVSVNPGNSGGPVLDDRGRVIGVVKAKAGEGEHLAFAIPLAYIQRGVRLLERTSAKEARGIQARHRLHVAEAAVLAAAHVYHRAMVAYLLALDPSRDEQGGGLGELGGVLEELDRFLLSDLRLEEASIRRDPDLTELERGRFTRLWTTYAELKIAVDEPQGAFHRYAAQCQDLGTRLQDLVREIGFGR